MLIEHADKARISRELVLLRLDTPLPLPIEALAQRDADRPALVDWLTKQGFRSTISRLGLDGPAPSKPSADAPPKPSVQPDLGLTPPPTEDGFGPYETVTTAEELRQWVAAATAAGRVALDTETDGLDTMRARLVGFSMATVAGRACYVPLAHEVLGEQIKLEAAIEIMGPMLIDPSVLKIFQNAKFDMMVLSRAGFPMPSPVDDTMLISYVLDAGRTDHGMDVLSEKYFGTSSRRSSAMAFSIASISS